MTDDEGGVSAPSWRKRHPVLSRAVLYGAGLLLVAVALGLHFHRQGLDEQDRDQYLLARLGSLDLLFGTDAGRAEMRRVLEQEFEGADLSPRIRARVHRVAAQIEAKDGHNDLALERVGEALTLSVTREERFATQLERAELLQIAGRGTEALGALAAAGEAPGGTLTLVAASVRAWLLEGQGRAEEGRLALQRVLEDQATAWQDADPVVLGVQEVKPSEAWIQASRTLCRLGPCESQVWLRVAELFPEDSGALVSSVRGLLTVGDRVAAGRIWRQLEAHDARTAAGEAAADARLEALRGELR